MTDEPRSHPFRHSHQDVEAADRIPDTPQTRAPAYRLAFTDNDFMCREELRPVRLQLELLKPQMIMDERGIQSTIVLMGSARIPAKGEEKGRATDALAGWYEEARKLARLITERSMDSYGRENVIVTGGGPGIMEAGNRGAHEAGGQPLIGLKHQRARTGAQQLRHPRPLSTSTTSRSARWYFLMRACAICIFPGGFGTLDEMSETLTLIQTGA